MKGCFEDHGDEVKRVDVCFGAQVVDLLMSPYRWVSVDDLELILRWIDEACINHRGDNLNIYPITV